MNVKIRLPANLRSLAEGQATIEVTANTVDSALKKLVGQFPELSSRLYDSHGKLLSTINLFRNDFSIRELDNLATELRDGDTLLVVSALAGG